VKRWALGLLLLGLFLTGVPAEGKPERESLVDFDPEALPREAPLRWGRDPFFIDQAGRGEQAEGEGERLWVSAIIFRQGKAVAIINDQIVRRGETIGGGIVSDILPDRVILREGRRDIELRVDAFAIK